MGVGSLARCPVHTEDILAGTGEVCPVLKVEDNDLVEGAAGDVGQTMYQVDWELFKVLNLITRPGKTQSHFKSATMFGCSR